MHNFFCTFLCWPCQGLTRACAPSIIKHTFPFAFNFYAHHTTNVFRLCRSMANAQHQGVRARGVKSQPDHWNSESGSLLLWRCNLSSSSSFRILKMSKSLKILPWRWSCAEGGAQACE